MDEQNEVKHPQAVDLGLPSGTKWASCNVGASQPLECGGYYAWGETEEKEVYDSTTYIHCDGLASTSHNLGENITGTEYDVAHVMWGDNWRMPTIEDVRELFDNCDYERIELIGVIEPIEHIGAYGIRFISKTNGKGIFLPAGGYRFGPVPVPHDYGLNGYYWLSEQSQYHKSDANALVLRFGPGMDVFGRYKGFSIRPVTK